MNPTKRSHIKAGQLVQIVLKQDQASGKLTEGIVKQILTNSQNHPRGIKVRLEDGQVGRVQHISEQPEVEEPLDIMALKASFIEEEEDEF